MLKPNKWKHTIIIIMIILIIILSIFIFKDKLLKMMYPKTYSEIISTYAEEYDV